MRMKRGVGVVWGRVMCGLGWKHGGGDGGGDGGGMKGGYGE